MNLIEKFTYEFGAALKEEYDEKVFDAVSANRWLAILKLNRLYNLIFNRFSIQKMPKINKDKQEVIKYNNLFFNLGFIRRILKLFYNKDSFEVSTKVKNKTNVLIFKLGDRGIIFAEMKDNHRSSKYEIEYNWNDIFLKLTTNSDMIL